MQASMRGKCYHGQGNTEKSAKSALLCKTFTYRLLMEAHVMKVITVVMRAAHRPTINTM